jgi:ABC-2 type transport system ATP-binding protein
VSELAIQTNDLTKRCGDLVAVDRLSLRVAAARSTGFWVPTGRQDDDPADPAGAGAPDIRQRTVLDARPGSSEGLAHIGAAVEAPGFYRFQSGRDNLRVMAKYAGAKRERVDSALEELPKGFASCAVRGAASPSGWS